MIVRPHTAVVVYIGNASLASLAVTVIVLTNRNLLAVRAHSARAYRDPEGFWFEDGGTDYLVQIVRAVEPEE